MFYVHYDSRDVCMQVLVASRKSDNNLWKTKKDRSYVKKRKDSDYFATHRQFSR